MDTDFGRKGWGCWCRYLGRTCGASVTRRIRSLTRGARCSWGRKVLIRSARGVIEANSSDTLSRRHVVFIFTNEISKLFLGWKWLFEQEVSNWFLGWFKAKCTGSIFGWRLLEIFVECLLSGGNLCSVNWVSRVARVSSFRFWNDCLQWVEFCLAREVVIGICDAGYAYFKLLKLPLVFVMWFRGASD